MDSNLGQPVQPQPLQQPVQAAQPAPVQEASSEPKSRSKKKWVLFLILALVVLILVGIGAYYYLNIQSTKQESVDRTSTPTQSPLDNNFIVPKSGPITKPSNSSSDKQRVASILSLRVALWDYFAANKAYPASLEDLIPNYLPKDKNGRSLTQLPVDPVTGMFFGYKLSPDKQDYIVSAILDSGETISYNYNGQVE